MKLHLKHNDTSRPSETGLICNKYRGRGIYNINEGSYKGKFYVRAGFGYAYFITPISQLSENKINKLQEKGDLN